MTEGGGRVWPDLRLASFAAGTWLASVAALHMRASGGIGLAAGAAVAATTLGIGPRLFRARGVRWSASWIGRRDACGDGQGAPDPRSGGAGPDGARGSGPWRGRVRGRLAGGVGSDTTTRWLAVGVALGAVCGAASTASRVAARDREPIAGLARAHATVTVTMTLRDDPHPVGAAHIGPPTYAVEAHASEISWASGGPARYDVDVPIFVLARSGAWPGLLPGQRLVARGQLQPPEPGELDAAVLETSVAPSVLGRPSWIERAAGSLRAGLQRACVGLPAQVGGLLPGLIDGDTTRLDPAVSAAFKTTGMTHLLAVSGSNAVLILMAALFLARLCRAGPVVTAIAGALALIGFVILVRPSPSVLRAATMGALGLVALATGRTGAAVPALAAVIAVLLAYDPSLATDIGFGLSVFATAGLLVIAPHWRDALCRRGWPAWIAEAVAVPAAAQVACSPLIAAISGSVSIVAVPANLVAAPAVPVATVVGVTAAVISPVWASGAAYCAWVASWPARWLLLVAERGAAAPAAVMAWPSGVWGGLLLAVAMAGLLVALRYPVARLLLAVGAVAAVVGIVPVRLATAGWPPAGALLVVCDVGQGDGSVLPLGHGAGIVVDTGPEPSAIDGCLRRLGISDVPIMFLTHFHEDHVGGITGALNGRRVDQIVVSPFDQPPEGYRDVIAAATARHIPMSTPVPGQVYMAGALRLTVLGPVSRLTGTRSDPNNNSIVMRADEDGVRLLLTGDAEIEEQNDVLANAGPAALMCDFLKFPHHGSSYQSLPFLHAASPAVAFVSVGAVNPYGLPNLPMLARVAAGGARILRTDQDGDLAALSVRGRLAVEYRGHPPGQAPP